MCKYFDTVDSCFLDFSLSIDGTTKTPHHDSSVGREHKGDPVPNTTTGTTPSTTTGTTTDATSLNDTRRFILIQIALSVARAMTPVIRRFLALGMQRQLLRNGDPLYVHVGGTRCVPSSTDNIVKIRARITLTVEFIHVFFYFYLMFEYNDEYDQD